jgi:hypothetical protein
MASFGNASVVESLWRTLTADEQRRVTHLLNFASAIIRSRVPDIDDRITAGSLDASFAGQIAAAMVIRVLKNPDGHSQESIDDFSYQIDAALATGALYLSDDEFKALRGRRPRSFSIRPSPPQCTEADLEQVALNRARWAEP